MKKLMYISGTIFSIMILLGILFRMMFWEFGPITYGLLTAFGIFGIALIFIPSFAVYNYNKSSD